MATRLRPRLTNVAALAVEHAEGSRASLSPLLTADLAPELSKVIKVNRLGSGVTSSVFLAVHVGTLQLLALKEIDVSSDGARRAVHRELHSLRTQRSPLVDASFTTEAQSCPHIVDYYGSIMRDSGKFCMALEYVARGSLQGWIDQCLSCPEPWLAHLAHQGLEALSFFHATGRLHRDIKPANLLITQTGDLKLADFGISTAIDDGRVHVVLAGTRMFMSPECLKGEGTAPSSDLWSLASTLATVALGKSPIGVAANEFEQISLAELAPASVSGNPGLSRLFADFLGRCLEPVPDARPSPRELMGHPFLELRHGWEKKCQSVMWAVCEGGGASGGLDPRNHNHAPAATVPGPTSTAAAAAAAAEAAAARAVRAIADARALHGLQSAALKDEAVEALARELGVPAPRLREDLEARRRRASASTAPPGPRGSVAAPRASSWRRRGSWSPRTGTTGPAAGC